MDNLPKQDQNAKKKIGNAWFIKHFWWNCLAFSDKLDLTIRMRIFINLKHPDVIWRQIFDFSDYVRV